MSMAEVCREAYMLSDTAIDMLLEEDKKEGIRSALEILESKVQHLPSGFGNRFRADETRIREMDERLGNYCGADGR